MSISKQTAEHTVVRPHDGALFGHENEWSADTCRRSAKRNEPDTKGRLLHGSMYTKHLEQANAGAGGRGE